MGDGIIEGEFEEVPGGGSARVLTPEAVEPAGDARPGSTRGGVWRAIAVVGIVAVLALGFVVALYQAERPAVIALPEPAPVRTVRDLYSGDSAASSRAAPTPADAPPAPAPQTFPLLLSEASMQRAVAAFEQVYASGGMAGAATYSRDCHARLTAAPSVEAFDHCAGFDLAGVRADAALTAQRASKHEYFDENAAAVRIRDAGLRITGDGAAVYRRATMIWTAVGDVMQKMAEGRVPAGDEGF